jgi:hypothetical protein
MANTLNVNSISGNAGSALFVAPASGAMIVGDTSGISYATGGTVTTTVINGITYRNHVFTNGLTEDFANYSVADFANLTPSGPVVWNGWTSGNGGIATSTGSFATASPRPAPYLAFVGYGATLTSPPLSFPSGRSMTLSFYYTAGTGRTPPTSVTVAYNGVTIATITNTTTSWQQYVSPSPFTSTGPGTLTFLCTGSTNVLITSIVLAEVFVVPNSIITHSLVVGGGGGGGNNCGGGGGAGGAILTTNQTVTAGAYPVAIGSGGSGGSTNYPGQNGGTSTFNGLTGIGGGGGGAVFGSTNGLAGGCGGGGFGAISPASTGGSALQSGGRAGGNGSGVIGGGGGGGMGSVGSNGVGNNGGNGGSGQIYTVGGALYLISGGGGAGAYSGGSPGAGGTGGGGSGSGNLSQPGGDASYYGGGGGGSAGGGANPKGGNGFQGIIVISYIVPATGILTAGTVNVSNISATGGITALKGFRPSYAAITGTSINTLSYNYGTHFNITNSGFNTILINNTASAADANAYWVFRNNTGSYFAVTVTYTTSGGGTGAVSIPPLTSLTILYTGATSGGSSAYVFF